ncbi:hypothetical protein [Actimicrobium antarcticum]|uniref:Uncharacterized protein n=1 Tax=Actimicrobium antarcticum TaxID=1051899 RepID=A0ABP7SVG7_9BURK
MKKLILLCAVTAVLTACGGGSSGTSGAVTPPSGTTFLDGFITFVMNLVSTSPEDTPAREIDSVGLTSPEDTPAAAVN